LPRPRAIDFFLAAVAKVPVNISADAITAKERTFIPLTSCG
jgi:hypothetical protein